MTYLPRLIVSLLLVAAGTLCPLAGNAPPTSRGLPAPPAAVSAARAAFATAAQADRDGRDAEAEAGYRSLTQGSDPFVAAEAQLALGRFLELRDQPSAARSVLEAASGKLGGTPGGLAAQFLLGESEADLHADTAAAASFHAYAQSGGSAADYAYLEEAWALQDGHDDRGALSALLQLLRSTSPTVRDAALSTAADSLARLGQTKAAAGDQRQRAAVATSAADRADAFLQAGKLYVQSGDKNDATGVLTAVVSAFPASVSAPAALVQLDALKAPVDPLQRGVVLFDQRQNDEAKAAFSGALAEHPTAARAAEATYYLAALDDRAGVNDAALDGYQKAFDLDPAGGFAGDALWARAQLLQSLDRYVDAEKTYAELTQRLPSDDHAPDSAFGAGLMAYLNGRPADAALLWEGASQASDSTKAARADLWLGKLAAARGDGDGAKAYWARAQAAQPAGYYGLRARALSAGTPAGTPSSPPLSPPATGDWMQVEAWLRSWAGAEETARWHGFEASADWQEAMALEAAGWQVTPDTLLNEALTGVQNEPWVLYRIVRALQERGFTYLALRTAERLLALAPGGAQMAPAALLQVAYPTPYLDLVNQDAAQAGIDPALVYALIRQESAFDPSAGSSAGAQGLTQLEPGTAQDVARSLGQSPPAAGDLARPVINLRLGTAYLAQEVHAAGGDLNQTLAGYNAGGGNAARWAREAGGDEDLFYELVDFSETRRYIETVSENYAIYNFLYRGGQRPSLVPSR